MERALVGRAVSREYSGSLERLARIGAFVAFTAVAAQFAVRLPYTPVPVTMQTLFVVLAGIVLGPRDGFYAMTAYLLFGLSGAPVFAGLTFGPAVIAGPTGGYLLAFPAAAMISGTVYGRTGPGRIAASIASISGSALILAGGWLYLSLWTGLAAGTALSLAVIPFVAAEAVKAALAAMMAGRRG